MKIDYELAEKIGAKMSNEHGQLFKFDENIQFQLMVWCDDEVWRTSSYSIKEAVDYLTPIPPKPPVRVEYEKVTESIFDLKDEFERGELYCKNLSGNDDFQLVRTVTALSGCYASSNIYRRIEKPVDEKEEFIKHCMEVATEDDTENDRIWMSKLYDSGVRLVTK